MNAFSQLDLPVGDNDPHNQVEQETWDASWKEREQKCQRNQIALIPKNSPATLAWIVYPERAWESG